MIQVTGGVNTPNVANVNTDFELAVATTKQVENAGFMVLASQVDDGSITGERIVRESEIDIDYRLRSALDTLIFNEFFPSGTVNTGVWSTVLSTMTAAVNGGFMVLNAGNATANANSARISTYRHFPVIGTNELYLESNIQFTQAPQVNNVVDFGFGIVSGTADPSDGVIFKVFPTGECRFVIFNNGVEVQSSPIDFDQLIGSLTTRNVIIAISHKGGKLWIDDQLVSQIDIPIAVANIMQAMSTPVFFRTYNTGVVSVAQQLKVAMVNVTMGGAFTNKAYPDTVAGSGGHSSQNQTGIASGSTANYANSANPTAAVPTNTTAALGSGLGGQFWETDTLAVNTDGIICSYQVPAGTSSVIGKQLYISKIIIDSFVQTALTGGGYVAQWSLAYGHTAVSLATAEGVATKAPRRLPLGIQSVASGALAFIKLDRIEMDLPAPVVVNPAEFVAVVKKKVGSAPSAGVIAHLVTIVGYFE